MLNMLRKRQENEEGFTLIELMVVVLIIAILLAIAIPTFLGARERAQDRAAQSDIRNTLTAEKVHYTDAEEYTLNGASTVLTDIEPSLVYDDTGLVDTDVVGLTIGGANNEAVCIVKESKGGNVFSVVDIATGADAGTYYADQDCPAAVSATAPGAPFVKTGW